MSGTLPMLHNLLFVIWFMLPIALANMAPVFAAVMPGLRSWDTPIDGGKTYRRRAIFGPHKTWRGIVSGIVLATLVLWLQQTMVRHFGWAASLSRDVAYSTLPTLLLGPAFGLGALGGDAIESFFKRQFDRKPGETWLMFDQIDFIIGGIVASLFFVRLPLIDYLIILLIGIIGHIVVSYIGYRIGLKEHAI